MIHASNKETEFQNSCFFFFLIELEDFTKGLNNYFYQHEIKPRPLSPVLNCEDKQRQSKPNLTTKRHRQSVTNSSGNGLSPFISYWNSLISFLTKTHTISFKNAFENVSCQYHFVQHSGFLRYSLIVHVTMFKDVLVGCCIDKAFCITDVSIKVTIEYKTV